MQKNYEKQAFRTRLPPILTISNNCDTLSNRLECHKVPRLPRKTTWQPAWKPSKRRGFAAPPIDTAKPQENQRLETRRVGAPKRAFRARLPPILTLCSLRIDVFLRVFWGTSKFATSKSNTTRLKCCACHAKWRWTRPKCCACHENCNASSENVAKVLRLPHKTTFETLRNTSECHKVPRLPRETKQRNVGNLPKLTPPAELTIGTAIRSSHERLRTVANGCGRLRTETQRRANTPSTPRPPEWNGNPCYTFGKNSSACRSRAAACPSRSSASKSNSVWSHWPQFRLECLV